MALNHSFAVVRLNTKPGPHLIERLANKMCRQLVQACCFKAPLLRMSEQGFVDLGGDD